MTTNARLAALAFVVACLMLTGGCGSVSRAAKVLGNDHDEVSIDYRRGVDIEDLPNPTPNDYKITIILRGQLKPGDDDPMATLAPTMFGVPAP